MAPRLTPTAGGSAGGGGSGGGGPNINVGMNATAVNAGINNIQSQFTNLQNAVQRNFQSMAQTGTRAFNSLTAPIREIEAALVSLFSVRAAVGLAKSLYDLNSSFTAVENTLLAVTGTQAGVTKEMDFLHQEALRLGVDFFSLTDQYSKLMIAGQSIGISMDKIREVFSATAEAGRVLHLSNQDMTRSFLALQQIMSKGKLQAEEIRKQFSNAIPGGFAIAAKAIGVTTAELDNLLKKGKVTAAQLIEHFPEAIREIYGVSLPAAISTSVAEFGRLKTELEFTGRDYAAQLEPVYKSIAMLGENLLKTFTSFISPQEFAGIVKGMLAAAADKVADFIDIVESNPFVVEGGLIGFFLFGGRGGLVRRIIAGGVGGVLGSVYNSLFGQGLPEQLTRAQAELDRYKDTLISARKSLDDLMQSRDIEMSDFQSKKSGTQGLFQQWWASDATVNGYAAGIEKTKNEIADYEKKVQEATVAVDDLKQKVAEAPPENSVFRAMANDLRKFASDVRSSKVEVKEVADKDFLVIFPEDFVQQARTWKDLVRDILGTKQQLLGFQNDITTGFTDMANGSKNAFADMVTSIIKQIERLIVQYYIAAPIINAFGQALGIQVGTVNANGNPVKGSLSESGGATGGTPLAHDTGGYIGRGQVGRVAERGSEMVDGQLVLGPANVVSRKDTAAMMNGAQTNVITNVNVKTLEGTTAEVEQKRNSEGGMDIEVIIKQVENGLASRYGQRKGNLFRAVQNKPF